MKYKIKDFKYEIIEKMCFYQLYPTTLTTKKFLIIEEEILGQDILKIILEEEMESLNSKNDLQMIILIMSNGNIGFLKKWM